MSGKGAIGWIGLDAPVEIIAAAGYRPVRMDPDPLEPITLASAYSEGGGHPWIRAAVERVLREGESLQGLVIGSTPVLGVWLYNFLLTLGSLGSAPPLPPIHLCNITHLRQPFAAAFNAASLRALAEALGATPAAVAAAIEERNALRGLLRRIEARRQAPGPALLGSQARRLLDAADTMDPADYLASAEQALAELTDEGAGSMTPIVLSAPGSPNLDLYRALEAANLVVVLDDMDFGSRAIGPDTPAGDPFDGLAQRYGDRVPSPSGWSTAARIEWVVAAARERGAAGVVFDLPAWAHSAAWDLPRLRRTLQDAGLAACVLPGDAPPGEAAAIAADLLNSSARGVRHG